MANTLDNKQDRDDADNDVVEDVLANSTTAKWVTADPSANDLRNYKQHDSLSADYPNLEGVLTPICDVIRSLTGGPFLSMKEGRTLMLWQYMTGPDTSNLNPIFYPIWSGWAEYLPKSMSPNAVTLCGGACIISAISMIWKYCGTNCPANADPDTIKWLYAFVAFMIWSYQTADALDGRQGKRTGMYTHASCQLYDHGLDNLVSSFQGFIAVALIGLDDSPFNAILMMLSIWGLFWITTHEHLMIGHLTFLPGLGNPTEGLLFAEVSYVLLGFMPQVFRSTLGDWGVPFFPDTQIATLFVLNCWFNMAWCGIWTMWRHGAFGMGKDNKLRPGFTLKDALVNWIPYLTMLAYGLYVFHPGSGNTFQNDFQTVIVIGFVLNRMCFRLIIAEMVRTHFPWAKTLAKGFPAMILVRFDNYWIKTIAATIAVVQYLGIMLNYQKAIVHYWGMEGPLTNHWWPEKPNPLRLKEKVCWLQDPTKLVNEVAQPKREQMQLDGKYVPLQDS